MALRENREARPWLRRNQGMVRAGYLTVLLGLTAQARSSCEGTIIVHSLYWRPL